MVTFDLDGVLCRPPFGINPGGPRRGDGGVGRGTGLFGWLLWRTERWRYIGRKPMPGASRAFAAASTVADCVILTARGEAARPLTERWLRRHLGVVPQLEMRCDRAEASARYKARRVRELGAVVHIEDDPNTARLVGPIARVLLMDWPRNRGLDAPNVVRVQSVMEAGERVRVLLSQTQSP